MSELIVTKDDLRQIHEKIQPVLDKKTWGVREWRYHQITFDFGTPLQPDEDGDIFGEWHIYIKHCVWRLETKDDILVASADKSEKVAEVIKKIDGLTLISIDVSPPALETTMTFETNLILRLFPVHTKTYDQWLLFTPQKEVLTIGPGIGWSYENEDDSPDAV